MEQEIKKSRNQRLISILILAVQLKSTLLPIQGNHTKKWDADGGPGGMLGLSF